MATIRFIRDTSRTRALANGGRRDEKILRGTVMENIRESSANWWVSKGDAVRVNGKAAGFAPVPAKFVPPVGDPFTEIFQGIEDGDFPRVFAAFAGLTPEDIEALAISDDSKLVLGAARGEVAATGTINDVSLPDLIDAASDAAKAMQTPPKLAMMPTLPAAPAKGKPGRPKRA